MTDTAHPVLTIGHSTHSLEAFLALLQQHGVTAVADVRSIPRSRFTPQFDRESLPTELERHGIQYVFLGKELGGRPDDRSCYEEGRVRYERVAGSTLFRRGIVRVLRGAREHLVALMCSEKEPLECHRALLVARALTEQGVVVQHILADGTLEGHDAAMERLLDVVGLPHLDLLHTKAELLAQALARQEERVAYVERGESAGTAGGAS